MQWTLSVIAVHVSHSVVPESPRWLYANKKNDKADAIVRKMAKVNGKELPEKLDVQVKVGPCFRVMAPLSDWKFIGTFKTPTRIPLYEIRW